MTHKNLLKDVNFDFEQDEDNLLGPHIAYTIEANGGAASGYNKPLLLKSEELNVTPDLIKSVEDLGVKVEKAMYADTIRSLITAAVREKEFTSPWDWIFVCDFNDTTAIISCDEGMYSVGYRLNGATVIVDDVASPVAAITDYVEVDGEVLISEDRIKEFEESLMERVNRSVKMPEVQEYFLKAIKVNKESVTEATEVSVKENSVIKTEARNAEETKPLNKSQTTNGDISVDNIQEIMKSAEFQEVLKAQIEAATAKERQEKEDLQKSLQSLQAAETKRQEDNYMSIVKSMSFVKEDKQEALVKAFMADPNTSLLLIEVLKAAHDEVEAVKAEFGKEVGADVKVVKTTTPDENDLVKSAVENFAKQFAKK